MRSASQSTGNSDTCHHAPGVIFVTAVRCLVRTFPTPLVFHLHRGVLHNKATRTNHPTTQISKQRLRQPWLPHGHTAGMGGAHPSSVAWDPTAQERYPTWDKEACEVSGPFPHYPQNCGAWRNPLVPLCYPSAYRREQPGRWDMVTCKTRSPSGQGFREAAVYFGLEF